MPHEPQPGDLREVPLPPELVTRAAEKGDGKAAAEATAFADQSLEKIASAKEHGRREQFRDHLSRGALGLLWLIIVLTGGAAIGLAWHCLMPAKWAWLSDSQLSKIQAFLFSGALIGAINGYTRRYM